MSGVWHGWLSRWLDAERRLLETRSYLGDPDDVIRVLLVTGEARRLDVCHLPDCPQCTDTRPCPMIMTQMPPGWAADDATCDGAAEPATAASAP